MQAPRRRQHQSAQGTPSTFRPRVFFRRLWRILLVLFLFVGLPCCGFDYMKKAVLADDSIFRVAHIVVTTDGVLTTDQILATAQVPTNHGLFAYDPAETRARLEKHHMVASAVVTRQLPNTLRLDVTERVPVARIVIQNGPPSLAIDAEGHVMGPGSVRTALPLILGLNDRALVPGDVSRDPLLPDLVTILRAIEEPDLLGQFGIRALDIRDRSRIRVVLDAEPAEEVFLSTKDYLSKLRKLPILRGVAKERGRTFHTYDLTVDNSFPAY